jgi:hypothetical protein
MELSQALLLARHHGIDLETEIERKWLYRITPGRPG